MTAQKDLKKLIRARMERTGESYTAARAMTVARPDAAPLPAVGAHRDGDLVEVVILKLSDRSARVRILGNAGEITLRTGDVYKVAPGQIASVRLSRCWTFRGDAYASGAVGAVRTDVGAIGLEPLPLEASGPTDPAKWSEPYDDDSDPYTALWRRFTGRERPAYRMHRIAWEGARPSEDLDDTPVSAAAEEYERGEHAKAQAMLMEVLHEDLRCIDAHAHLGNWAFSLQPERALVHYGVGIAIGDLSLATLPADALLPWGPIYNRPYLRCLMGRGLCEWRQEHWTRAEATFERILELNPVDNQGARACWHDVRTRVPWAQLAAE